MDTLAVAAGPAIILGVILYANARQNVDKIKKEWTAYRCHPAYMPFSTMFSETPVADNFTFCVNAFASEIFARATDPVYQIFDMFAGIANSLLGDIQHFLTFLAGIDTFIFNLANSVFGKLQNTIGVLVRQMGSIRDIINRIASSAYYTVFIAQTLVDFVMSSFNLMMTIVKVVVIMIFALGIILSLFYPVVLAFFIPIGAMFGVSYCFHPNTVVHTDRGRIRIRDVIIGDVIAGSRVTSTFVVACLPSVTLYNHNGTIVSGQHIVYHGGTWKYVKDVGVLYRGQYPDYLICLNTSDNLIEIEDDTYRDYEEVSDHAAVAKIEEIVWGRHVCATYPTGLHPRTLVRRWDHKLVPVSTIRVGDNLVEGRVTGVVKIDASDIVWYDVEGCVMSGCQPVFGRIPRLAKEIGVRSEVRDRYAVQLILDSTHGWFSIHNKLLVRDYVDSHELRVLDKIQDVVIQSLHTEKVAVS